MSLGEFVAVDLSLVSSYLACGWVFVDARQPYTPAAWLLMRSRS